MGNHHTKEGTKSLFTSEETKMLETSFRSVSGGHTEKLTESKLLESWSSIVDVHLAQFTANFLYKNDMSTQHQQQRRVGFVGFKRYAEPFFILEHGSIDEQLRFLNASLGSKSPDEVDLKQLELYITSVLSSYLHIQREHCTAAYESWHRHGYQANERSVHCFAKGLVRSLSKDAETTATRSNLERWLQENPTFVIMWREVFTHIYRYQSSGSKAHKSSRPIANHIIPILEGLQRNSNYTPILDIPHVIFVNSNLQNELRHKWRFLFSSKIMGESFSTMLGKLLKKGPTLLVVEDEDHFIFAAYAPHSWSLGPNFIGDDSAMLFTLSPAMRCFNTTGYNDHYQYLNINQQTMPNGLGMGGQFNYWGFWLDCEYGLGQSSESCTTFKDYVQLSKRKDFRIRNIEVWGIGDEPKSGEDSEDEILPTNRTILDKNMEDRVMLELAGHRMVSEGVREPKLDL